jgi:ParB family chromosome partitioning protein
MDMDIHIYKHLSSNDVYPFPYAIDIFDEEKIEELARTIHIHGIIQPIVVREFAIDQYEIIAGERRFRAMKKLGWTEAPAIIKNLSDTETASVALIENLQR